MQRQSLGSPVTKLHPHGGADTLSRKQDTKPVFKDRPPSTSLSPDADDLDHKSTKPRRFSSSLSVLSPAPPKPEKIIHLIPFLILFCFLVLFLLSHTPSQSDLAQFNGFYNHIEAAGGSIDALNEVRRGDVLEIRSFRNLQGIAADELTSLEYRFHRKFAHF
ncbi:hypothetical protein SADUNF_Sadunf01G0112400 [Salix dunnii]|uniref:Uncharacterized protein n=1 Tax=Salix dunnii TaxID=1413687 RepID=A0A835NAM1_9ROSI|nr:hypothetical protein SADUNF_Sadunf01G0112400 [Salix dunnii]